MGNFTPAIGWILLLGLASVSQLYTMDVVTPSDDNGTLPMLCYFGFDDSWPDNGTVHPALNATLCTHILFISTSIKENSIVFNNKADYSKYISKIPLLRKQNPKLKCMISNGGEISPVLASAENRTMFVRNSILFLKKYDLDGLDIDWEFPGWPPYPREQRPNYTMIMQEFRDEIDKEAAAGGRKYILSAAVGAGRSVMEVYNVSALAKSVDFINLMCYDLHTYQPPEVITGYNSPLYPNDWWKKLVLISGSVGWSSYEWYKRGMPKSKIMVGIPTYSHSWTLEKPDQYHGLYAPATGPGKCDGCSYAWVCDFIKTGGTVVWDADAAVPYTYKGDQWVSYDNIKSMQMKTDWIVQNEFGGVMIFCFNTDDYYGTCGQGKFPLVTSVKNALQSSGRSRQTNVKDVQIDTL